MFDVHLNVNYLISKLTGSGLVYPKSCSSEHDFLSSAHFLRLWLAVYTVQNSTKEWNDSVSIFDIWDTFLPSCRVSDYRLVWILHASPNPVTAPPPPSPIPIRHQPTSGLTYPRSTASRCRHLQFPWAPLPCAPSLLSILMEWWRVWNPHWPSQKARAMV